MKKFHYLAAVRSDSITETEQGIRVPVLAFVSGESQPVGGRKSTRTVKEVQSYCRVSNSWLDSGEEIPFFGSPHDLKGSYDTRDKIGLVGKFSARKITEEDLPNDKFRDLVGKTGAFSTAEILDDEAIAQYRKGLISKVSVGLGDVGKGAQFFELSAVPWGGCRGAMLYGHPLMDIGDTETTEVDDEQKPEGVKIYALTMDGAIAERSGRYESPNSDAIYDLTNGFQQVLANIQTTADAELLGRDRRQLMAAALTDFSTMLRAKLGLTDLTPVPSGENFMFDYGRALPEVLEGLKAGGDAVKSEISSLAEGTALTAEQFTAALDPAAAKPEHYALVIGAIAKKMEAPAATTTALDPAVEQRFSLLQSQVTQVTGRAEAAEAELAKMRQRQVVGDRFTALKARAGQLTQQGKLTKHQYFQFFPEKEAFSAAVDRFMLSPSEATAAGHEKHETLDAIEAKLDFAATLEANVQTGSVVGAEDIQESEMSDADLARVERFIKNNTRMSEQERERALAALPKRAAA